MIYEGAQSPDLKSFYDDRQARTEVVSTSEEWLTANKNFIDAAFRFSYMYEFDWLGRPIIQLPADIALIQHMIWTARPTIVLETGVAHGGSLVASASFLSLLDYCDWKKSGDISDITQSKRRVIGIDIDIREHNRELIRSHPMADKILLIDGDSTAEQTIAEVESIIEPSDITIVFLDSNHTSDHVYSELEIYSKLVSDNGFLVAFDTVVEDFPVGHFPGRLWGTDNGPLSAVEVFLQEHKEFVRDPVGTKLAMNSASRFGVLTKSKFQD